MSFLRGPANIRPGKVHPGLPQAKCPIRPVDRDSHSEGSTVMRWHLHTIQTKTNYEQPTEQLSGPVRDTPPLSRNTLSR